MRGICMAVFRKKGSRLGGIIAISCLILGLIFFGIFMIADSNLAKKEIYKVTESKGGKVLSIHKVNLEESPFFFFF
jgi:hypothetical protein